MSMKHKLIRIFFDLPLKERRRFAQDLVEVAEEISNPSVVGRNNGLAQTKASKPKKGNLKGGFRISWTFMENLRAVAECHPENIHKHIRYELQHLYNRLQAEVGISGWAALKMTSAQRAAYRKRMKNLYSSLRKSLQGRETSYKEHLALACHPRTMTPGQKSGFESCYLESQRSPRQVEPC